MLGILGGLTSGVVCMHTDFPVDKECVSYRTLWNMFKRVSTRMGLSASEKAEVFAGTARRAYQLPQPTEQRRPGGKL